MSRNGGWESLLVDYLEHMEVERQVSRYTIRNYQHYIRRFIEWIKASHKKLTVEKLTLKDITKYRLFLSRYIDEKGNPLSRTTQAYHVIALRSWFKWMSKQDIEVLDLSGNMLTSLQAEIRHLSDLRSLDLSNNTMTNIPAELGQLSKLEILDLRDNRLTGLPYELSNLKNLKTLDLRGNSYNEPDLDVIRRGLSSGTRILTD